MASQKTLTGTESPAHMDNESKNKVSKVMYKLAALDDFFSFYRVVHDRMSLRGESISGLSLRLKPVNGYCFLGAMPLLSHPPKKQSPRG